jgi:hypothetical protein
VADTNLHTKIPSQRAMEHITMQVTVDHPTLWRVRFWLGMRLLRLAAWVVGCGIEIQS